MAPTCPCCVARLFARQANIAQGPQLVIVARRVLYRIAATPVDRFLHWKSDALLPPGYQTAG